MTASATNPVGVRPAAWAAVAIVRYSVLDKQTLTRTGSGWLAMAVDPATTLASTDVVPAGEDWNRLAARTVVLDRIRLASLLAGDESPRPRLAAVFSWLEEGLRQVAELP